MKKYKGQLLLSATDLNAFLECRHKSYLTIKNLHTPLQKKEDDAHDQLLIKKGKEHETNYLNFLKLAGYNVFEVPQSLGLEEKIRITQEAMEKGHDFIYQAALLHEHWHGYADLLRRVDVPSKLGTFSYEVLDTKISRNPKPNHIVQLCVYSDLLGKVQGIDPQFFSLILAGSEEKRFSFMDFAHYYSTIKRQCEAYVLSLPGNSHATPCRACSECPWENLCDEQWEQEDHLSQIANIKQSQVIKLEEVGITTLKLLALSDENFSIPNLQQQTFQKLRSQAKLQYEKRITGEKQVEILPPSAGKGFARLPESREGDLFFDMEGDPLHYPDGLDYLFGISYHDNGVFKFKSFWAHNEEEEKLAFQEVMDFIIGHLDMHPEAHIYHYNHYEATELKRLSCTYGTREAELDNILRKNKLVDLYKVVVGGIRTSEPGYSIKDLEVFYMKRREGDVATAKASLVVYDQWKETKDPVFLKQISDYNEEDCRSTYLLREWLLKLRPQGIAWSILAEAEPEKEVSLKQKEMEEKRLQYETILLQGITGQERSFRELIVHLLEFHRREGKPGWWEFFSTPSKELDELMDDAKCLAGLTLEPTAPAIKEKRSMVYTYNFPSQNYKLKDGESCTSIESLENIGTIFSINEDACKVMIKSTGNLPSSLSITSKPSFNERALRDAIYRFADAIIEGNNTYAALESFLKREKPRFDLCTNDNELQRISKAVSSLQDGYLLVQGPPGAGKTYTSSRIIIDLIRSGKRVGVSSNSHKAINNLLSAIEQTAKEQGMSFRGEKKSSQSKPETFFNGEMIKDIFDNKKIDLNVDLIAGTAWLFADPLLDQNLDYLFIDEAGQVSIANLVAMGMSARNIILVGDQMQLSQPTKGIHPGSSGMSILEYILREEPIVSPDLGFFLGKTWRMHKDICRFISKAIYQGRLQAVERNHEQSLILSDTAHPYLMESGIQFFPVEHEGCGQKSEEEGKIVRELYTSLMKQSYRDHTGKVNRFSQENVLVVTPYNMQANHLKSILPDDARVGTVDMLQGQEAEVVLVSMVTSNEEELPRDMEFLYSKNRLNVAISRAKTLVIVIASPQLLEISCKTVDQIKLVNTLCWVSEYGSQKRKSQSR